MSSTHFRILDFTTGLEEVLDAAQFRARFERDGVVVLPDFLTAEELPVLREELANHFATCSPFQHNGNKEGTKDFACDVISWDPLKEGNAVFRELADEPKFAQVTEASLGAGFTAPASLVMYSVGGGRGQAWHQDCPAEDTGFNLNRLFYPDDVTFEDGAIVFVPGSHRFGRIPPGGHQDPIAGEVVLAPKAGTLVLLHGHVYHRVTPNLNMKPRTSINFRAFPAGVAKEVTCIGVYRNGSVNFCDQPKMHDGTPAMAMAGMGKM